MRVENRGPGEPEVAVVYCTHGDEPAGKKAVEKLLETEPEFQKGVKFVFANQKAYREGERFVDTDLNRSFPGDPRSRNYEERIASEMMEELQDLKTLDIHETVSEPVPFGLFTGFDDETIETLKSTDVEKAVEISYTSGCGINFYGGVEVEVGPRGTDESTRMAFRILERFLVNNGVIDGRESFSWPEIYQVYSEVERPEGEWSSSVENFREVGSGEPFAVSSEGEELVCKESFVPVLMAESYPDIFGFKAVRLEKVEERIFSIRGQKR